MTVESNFHVGRPNISDGSALGAGALLLQDLPDQAVAYGSPARVVRARAADEAYL